MKNTNLKNHFQIKTAGRKLIAFLCSLMLLISSSGITAFADDGIYSVPVTAPGNQTTETPAPEIPEESFQPENPDETPAPDEAGPENTEAPAEQQQDGKQVPEDDGIVYEAGSLAAELDDCSALIEYTAEARIPEGAKLTLRKAEGMEVYACMKSASKLLKNQEPDETWNSVLAEQGNQFYVITLTNAEDEEIKPASGVILTFQQPEAPEGVTYVLTGDEAAFLEAPSGIIRVVGYAMDPLGYVVINKEQIANVTLVHNGRDFTVTATYGPDAGFPAGTEMQVREIKPGTSEYALYSGMTEEALNEDWSEITLERYFDITFVSGGKEIEPQAEIDVQIEFKEAIELTEEHDVQAVHIENNEATVIETETDSNAAAMFENEAIDTVSFSSDSFSVYGVVQRKKITKKVLAADGNTYEINMTYGPEAEIPEGAELKVVEIPEGSDLWEAYRQQTAAALGADDVRLPGLYDITIVFEGQEIEPKAPVSVVITLANAEAGNEDLHVVHFTEDIPQELVNAAAEQKEEQTEVQPLAEEDMIGSEHITDAVVEGDTVTFETDGFSVYAFAYTVDFYYGEYEYHLTGNGEMLLSQLFILLNIDRNAADVINVSFTDPTLIQVEQVAGDWKLTSLKAFRTIESLTLNFANGDTIVVRVEDAQYAFKATVNQDNAGYLSSKYLVKWSGGGYRYADDVGEYYGNVTRFSLQAAEERNDPYLHYGITATPNNGFQFVYWLVKDADNNISYVYEDTLPNTTYLNGTTTFIAFFVPDNNYLIRVNWPQHYSGLWADNGLPKNCEDILYYYSGDNAVLHVNPDTNNGYTIMDWYDEDGTVVAENTTEFRTANATRDLVLTPIGRNPGAVNIYYQTTFPEAGKTYVTPETEVYNGRLDGSTAYSSRQFKTNPDRYFIGWLDENYQFVTHASNYSDRYDSALHFTPSGDQIYEGATYTAFFVQNNAVLVSVDSGSAGRGSIVLVTGTNDDGDSTYEEMGLPYIHFDSNSGHTDQVIQAVPSDPSRYKFDHWEINGRRINTSVIDDTIDLRNYMDNIWYPNELKAVFTERRAVVYDIGVIRQVGNNSADYQEWTSVPWCSNNFYISLNENNQFTAPVEVENNQYIYDINLNWWENSKWIALPRISSDTHGYDDVQRVSRTLNGYNLLTHTFRGWKLEDGTIKQPGEWVEVTGSTTITAVWDAYLPNKNQYLSGSDNKLWRYNTNTVGFFVRIVDNVADIGDTSKYTTCLFTTRMVVSGSGSFATNYGTNGTRHDFYGNGRELNLDNIKTIDAGLRANADKNGLTYNNSNPEQSHDSIYDGANIKLGTFPSDDLIFSRIRSWNANQSENNKITVSGQVVPQYMLTSEYFEVKWYVLKDQENSWHVDGMLIPKYAKLRVTKKFIGKSEAITAAKEGFGINVYKGSEATGTAVKNLSLSNYETVSSDGTEYTWIVEQLIPLTAYTVQEYGYSAQGYSASTSWQIINTEQTSGLHSNPQNQADKDVTAHVEKVYCYPGYVSQDSYQTVAYTNQYTEPYMMTIMKQDGETKNALPGATFDITVTNSAGNPVSIESPKTSDKEGKIGINFRDLGAGEYDFVLDERPRQGYQALDPEQGVTHITGHVTVASDGLVTLSGVTATVTGNNVVPHVDVNNPAVVYVENKPERTEVTVRKQWKQTNGENLNNGRPVTMQLIRNGVSLTGMTVVLGSNANKTAAESGDGIARTTAWEYTWPDLPAYVDGVKAVYTVREEWIGEPGGNGSIHYDISKDTDDGYANYIVTQSRIETVEPNGDVTVLALVENTEDHGQVLFNKVDNDGKAVIGATFKLYSNYECTSEVGTYTSTNGIVAITGQSAGDYWLKETSAPEGYQVNDKTYYVKINSTKSYIAEASNSNHTPDKSAAVKQVIDPPVEDKTVKLRKLDRGDSSKKLQGIKFEIYDGDPDDGGQVINFSEHADWWNTISDNSTWTPQDGGTTLVSDSNGRFYYGKLPAGTYYVKETETISGYIKPSECFVLVIPSEADGKVTVADPDPTNGTANFSIDNGTHTFYNVDFLNDPIPTTNITVQKEWVGDGGNHKVDSVEVKLVRYKKDDGNQVTPVGDKTYLTIAQAVSGITSAPSGFNETTYTISGPTTISNAVAGTKYEVEPGNYTISVDNASGTSVGGYNYTGTPDVSASINAGEDKTVTVTSNWSAVANTNGTLTITHKSSGLTDSGLPTNFAATYSYSGTNGSASNLAAGSYTVPEGDYTVVATVTNSAAPDGYTYVEADYSINVHVSAGGTATAEFTSTYEQQQSPPAQTVKVSIYYGNNGVGIALCENESVEKGSTITIKVTSHGKTADGRTWKYEKDASYNNLSTPISYSARNEIGSDDYWGQPHTKYEFVYTVVVTSDINIGIKVEDNSGLSDAVQGSYTVQAPSNPNSQINKLNPRFFIASADGIPSGRPSALPADYVEDEDFDGTVELTSSNSWTHVFSNLPVKDSDGNLYYYEFQEITSLSDYDVEYDPNGPIVAAEGSMTFTATNTYNKPTTGDLTVSKTVTGNDGSHSKDFEFTVSLTGHTGTETYNTVEFRNGAEVNSTVTFNDGTATFTLKHNEWLTIKDLPENTGYTVTETPVSGYTTTTAENNTTGTIPAGGNPTVAFTNEKNIYGNITITKEVTGDDADTSKEFTFNFYITNDDYSTRTDVNGSLYGHTFTNGVTTFKLKHGDVETFSGMPNGMCFKIEEVVDAPEAQYWPTAKRNGDTVPMPIKDVVSSNDAVAYVVTNTKLETVNIVAEKAFTDGAVKPTAVQFTLRRKSDDADDFDIYETVTVTAADDWRHEWTGLRKYERTWAGDIEYSYFVVETGLYFGDPIDPIPDDAWVAANISRSSEGIMAFDAATNTYSITITNTSYTDVPVVKGWPDFSNAKFDWYAKFQLYKMEVLKYGNGDTSDAALTWTPVTNGNGDPLTVTATKANNTPVFSHLDVYSKHANGNVYQVLYKVEEYEYKVWENGDEEHPIAQWSANNSFATISYNNNDYAPAFTNEVAGEDVTILSLDERYTIVVDNMPQQNYSGKLVVEKEWMHILPEDLQDFPEVYFTLYYLEPGKTEMRDAKLYGAPYVDYPLNYANNWKVAIDNLPQENRYFIVETAIPNQEGSEKRTYDNDNIPGGIYVGRHILVDEDHTIIDNRPGQQKLYYYNIEGYESREVYGQGSWNDADPYYSHSRVFKFDEPHRHAVSYQGEIKILNKCPAEYMQMDLKKKFLEYRTDSNGVVSLWTTTSEDDEMRNLYIKLQMYRRIVIDDPNTVDHTVPASDVVVPWDTYGVPFLVGYNKAGNEDIRNPKDNPFVVEDAQGTWAYRIPEREGLPRRGLYKTSDGKYIQVRYQYLFREVDVLDGDFNSIGGEWAAWLPYLWESRSDMNSQAEVKVFELQVAQDQDRILNTPGAALTILKDWVGGHSDITEIYVKVYRRNAGSSEAWVDYTEEICKEMSLGAIAQDYLENASSSMDRTHKWLVLNESNHWKVTIHHVPILNKNNNGYPFEYKIVEVGYKDIYNPDTIHTQAEAEEQFNPEYLAWDISANDFATVTTDTHFTLKRQHDNYNQLMVRNTVPTGTLNVSKVLALGSTAAETDIFTFNVTLKNSDDTAFSGDVTVTDKDRAAAPVTVTDGTLTVSVAGAATAVIDGLPDGTKYEVSETSTSGWKQKGTVSYDGNQVIAAGETETATVTNEQITSITVKKTWNGSTENWPDGYTVYVTLKAGNAAVETSEEENSEINPVLLTTSKRNATWTNLPMYDASGNPITYTVVETAVEYGETAITNYQNVFTITGPTEQIDGSYLIDNTPKTTYRNAEKDWNDNDNEDGLRPDSIKFTLSGTYTPTGGQSTPVDLSAYGITAEKTITPDPQTHTWPKAEWTGLPVYTFDGYEITYSVSEGHVEHYSTVIGSLDATNNTWTIINTPVKTEIHILKADDSDTPQPLTGAEFKLEKLKGSDYVPVTDYSLIKVDGNGTAVLNNLTDGTYHLTETKAPTGYVAYKGDIEFTITDGVVAFTDNDYVSYVKEENESFGTFTVKNTAGAALPSTGGSGTLPFTIGGLALILIAGIILAARKRRKA